MFAWLRQSKCRGVLQYAPAEPKQIKQPRLINFIPVFFLMVAAYLLFVFPAVALETTTEEAVYIDYQEDFKINHPNFFDLLPTGNLLICRVGYQKPAVAEVTPDGQEVWSFPGIQANSALRLANGNCLLADSGAPGPPYTPRVCEVSPQGNMVWEYRFSSLAQAPRYAERLANGHTLITMPFKIIEVTPAKKVVWSYGWGKPVSPGIPGHLACPVQATRLANGNTLVVDRGLVGGRVFELTPQKQIVWQYGTGTYPTLEPSSQEPVSKSGYLKQPVCAVKLPDGHTLISDLGAQALITVSMDGKLINTVSWQSSLTALPVLNQWWARPLTPEKVLVAFTLTSLRSRILLLSLEKQQNTA
ncbi:MAG TPA: hypothetical protein DCK87_00365 [Desulfotomaculum sp.]|nr:hypothetical protein [Desulfotomaculum sp.]